MKLRGLISLLCLLAICIPLESFAFTLLTGGPMFSDQIWTPAGNPYMVQGDITVMPGVTLTITPGVQVLFAPTDGTGGGVDPARCELIIQGHLNAWGASANPVVFRAISGSGSGIWYGIILNNSQSGTLSYCQISNAVIGVTVAGAASVAINNSFIGTCSSYGIDLESLTVNSSICGNSLTGCARGINSYNSSAVSLLGNTLNSCTNGIWLDGSAVYSNVLLQGNKITNSTQAGVYVSGSTTNVVLTGNTVTGNGTYGVNITGSAQPDLGNVGDASTANDGGNLLQGNTLDDVYNNTANLIKAEGNSWGTQNTALIDAHIYDFNDNAAKGLVDYSPFLEQMYWTPTATVTYTSTISPTATPSFTTTTTATGTPTLTASPSATATPTVTATPSISATGTITATITASPTLTASSSASPIVTISATRTVSPIMTITATFLPTGTVSPTVTQTMSSPGVDLQGKAFLVYPNPGRNHIIFSIQPSGAGEIKGSLYNLAGERVARLSTMPSAGSITSLIWDCGSVPPGVYLARIMQDGKELGKSKVAVVR